MHRRCGARHVTRRRCRDQPCDPGCCRYRQFADRSTSRRSSNRIGPGAGSEATRIPDNRDATIPGVHPRPARARVPEPRTGKGALAIEGSRSNSRISPADRPSDRYGRPAGTRHRSKEACGVSQTLYPRYRSRCWSRSGCVGCKPPCAAAICGVVTLSCLNFACANCPKTNLCDCDYSSQPPHNYSGLLVHHGLCCLDRHSI
jgi:hypothetical protein